MLVYCQECFKGSRRSALRDCPSCKEQLYCFVCSVCLVCGGLEVGSLTFGMVAKIAESSEQDAKDAIAKISRNLPHPVREVTSALSVMGPLARHTDPMGSAKKLLWDTIGKLCFRCKGDGRIRFPSGKMDTCPECLGQRVDNKRGKGGPQGIDFSRYLRKNWP